MRGACETKVRGGGKGEGVGLTLSARTYLSRAFRAPDISRARATTANVFFSRRERPVSLPPPPAPPNKRTSSLAIVARVNAVFRELETFERLPVPGQAHEDTHVGNLFD